MALTQPPKDRQDRPLLQHQDPHGKVVVRRNTGSHSTQVCEKLLQSVLSVDEHMLTFGTGNRS